MEQNQQSTAEQYSEQIEQLMELGRTQGYLTYAEINDLLPEDVIDPNITISCCRLYSMMRVFRFLMKRRKVTK